ncbi:colicin E3/pyocin S6 family cytotoxin [Clostridium gasigenes]|uniref:Cytotoxic n=1 Tax=Clostridium gasigenes TaxID=94869 RepID=A0A1H0VGA0_9CLOT|nr:colicin E3/pyocin S6 family cytotoxin [Clostridium gasigenes]SDP77374.1 Cytotoxic [Clostridium gasigenes]
MAHIVLTSPSFLDGCIYWKVVDCRKIWRSIDGSRLYTWDEFHGEIEVFNKRGRHLGSADKYEGRLIKDAVKGRRLDV